MRAETRSPAHPQSRSSTYLIFYIMKDVPNAIRISRLEATDFMNFPIISSRALEEHCPVGPERTNDGTGISNAESLGTIHRMPLELKLVNLAVLDVKSLLAFRQVNRRARNAVESMLEWKKVCRIMLWMKIINSLCWLDHFIRTQCHPYGSRPTHPSHFHSQGPAPCRLFQPPLCYLRNKDLVFRPARIEPCMLYAGLLWWNDNELQGEHARLPQLSNIHTSLRCLSGQN